jgi:hypothetical protein
MHIDGTYAPSAGPAPTIERLYATPTAVELHWVRGWEKDVSGFTVQEDLSGFIVQRSSAGTDTYVSLTQLLEKDEVRIDPNLKVDPLFGTPTTSFYRFVDLTAIPATNYSYRILSMYPDGRVGTSNPSAVATPRVLNPDDFWADLAPRQYGESTVSLVWSTMAGVAFYLVQGPGLAPTKVYRGEESDTAVMEVPDVPPGTHTYMLIAYYGGTGPSGTTYADESHPATATVTVPATR